MPLATKLWPPSDGRVVNLLDAVRLDRDDRVPEDVVDREQLELSAVEDRSDATQSLPRGGVSIEGGTVVLAAESRLERPGREALFRHRRAHRVPDLDGHRVHVGVGLGLSDEVEQPSRSNASGAVDTNLLEKATLAVDPGDVEGEAVAVAGLVHGAHSRRDAEPEQQAREVVDEPTGRRGVVDPATAAVLVDGDRPVGRPDVAQEKGDLPLRDVEDASRDELLVTPQPEGADLVQPRRDRVTHPVREAERGSQPQGRAPRGRVLVAHRDHAEGECGR